MIVPELAREVNDDVSDPQEGAADPPTTQFLQIIYPRPIPGKVLIWTVRDDKKMSHWFDASDVTGIEAAVERHANTHAVYMGCGLSPDNKGPYSRCAAKDIAGIPGLWADIDIKSEAHKKAGLPPDLASAIKIANQMPVPPSIVVNSGHGIYPWWLLDSYWGFKDATEREDAAALMVAWQAQLKVIAKSHKWTIDSTADLARVLRIPGSINHKLEPVPVTMTVPPVIRRYTLQELKDALASVSPKAPPKPPNTETGAPMSDEAIKTTWRRAKNGAEIEELHNGGNGKHETRSEADAAYVCHLAFYTKDAAQIDRMFRASARMRAKWDEVHYANGDTYGVGTIKSALETVTASYSGKRQPSQSDAPSTDAVVKLHDLELIVIEARKTKGGKLSAQIAVNRAGVRINVLTVTSASSARIETRKNIANYLPDKNPLAMDIAIGQLMVAADVKANMKQAEHDGETIQEIITREVTQALRPAYRIADRIHCEGRGELRRQDIIAYSPNELMKMAAGACDAPLREDGTINRPALLKAMKVELEVFHADLMKTLPEAATAQLAMNSGAGKEFRAAMIKMLTLPKTWESSADGHSRRASLISRAVTEIRSKRVGKAKGWNRVLAACNFWFRFHLASDGELQDILACRWELAHQIGVPLPGVVDQESLTTLGIRYGVIDPDPQVPVKVQHGEVRLAVFREAFIRQLLLAAEENLVSDDSDADTK